MRGNRFKEKGFLDTTGELVERVPDDVRVSSSAVILADERYVLLQKRTDNEFWGLPGGGMEPGESPQSCVQREVHEETGLQVNITCPIRTYTDMEDFTIMRYPNGDLIQYINFLFLCVKIDGVLSLCDETMDLRYFPSDKFPKNTLLSVSLRVKDTLDHIDTHHCVK